MSVFPSAAIGDLVASVTTWVPERDDPDGAFVYIDLSAVDQDAKVVSGAREIACAEAPSRARQLVRTGDVLVSTVRPNLNGVALVPLELDGATASTGFCVLRPRPDKLDGAYLFHWVRSPRFVSDMGRKATGASYPAVSDRIVNDSKLPVPPLPEQRRIAEILDKAEALGAKRRAALAELDTLSKSIFFDSFGDPTSNPKGWPIVPLPSVIYFQEGPGVRNWQFRNEGIKLVNVGNIVEGRLVTENTMRYLDPQEVERRYKHFLLDVGDFVVASSGVTWGKIAEVEERHLPLCLNTSMIRFRPLGGGVEKSYIRAFVESPEFRRQILRLITGSAQPNFGPAHLEQVRIPLPPVSLQREFARRVTAVEKLKTTQRASLAEMAALFASLQYRAFQGDL